MWEYSWSSGNTYWDLAKCHPYLIKFIGSDDSDKAGVPRSGRAFVPGCGQVSPGAPAGVIVWAPSWLVVLFRNGSGQWLHGVQCAERSGHSHFGITNLGNRLSLPHTP